MVSNPTMIGSNTVLRTIRNSRAGSNRHATVYVQGVGSRWKMSKQNSRVGMSRNVAMAGMKMFRLAQNWPEC